jgi:hypothetical protein
MSTNKELKRIEKELQEARENRGLASRTLMGLKRFKKLAHNDKELELVYELAAIATVKRDKYDIVEKEFEAQITLIKEKLKKKADERLNKKLAKLNPNYKYITHKVEAHPIGYTPEAIEALIYKDNKILIWDKGYSTYVDRGSGVMYSTSTLTLINARHMELREFGFGNKKYINYGDHGRYTGRGEEIKLSEGGKMSKALIEEHIEEIRKFFNQPELMAKDVVRNMLLCLSPTEEMKQRNE